MKVTYNWLKQYVDFSWSPEELRERLTMLGLEVERMERMSGEFEGVVVAQILASDKHPNADKLSVCRVADGQGERQIVCGAKNYKVGDKVPLILPGASLPARAGEQPFTIKVSKMRGVESQGMLCSPKELGLADDAEGLLILAPEAKVGQPFAEHLGRSAGDVVYDLEITPNRPDWNSVIGIAREISALTGNPLRMPKIGSDGGEGTGEPAELTERLVQVRIEDAELCPRYTARVVRGVKIGPSPDWLRQRLEKVGIRSISNVVDVTNFVMMETGQPLHAFDYKLLSTESDGGGATIIIRRARAGEPFTTIDGQKRTLTDSMLVIADPQRAIALAGVMGGQNTEINAETVDVLIESAYFKPQNIRATSKDLELRTESSYRFERGGDVGICDWASRRAADLILEAAQGRLAKGVVDAYPRPSQPRQISLRYAKVSQLLGIEIPVRQSIEALRRLGLEIVNDNGAETCTVRIPTFRVDLKEEVDLTEEIARLYGIEKIPASAPRGAVGSHAYDAVHDQLTEVRRILTGLGLDEAQGQTLISEEGAKLSGSEPARLANPLSSDMNVLRPSLLPGLLDSLRQNVSRKNREAALFEIGRVFLPGADKAGGRGEVVARVREERRIAVALSGQRNEVFWTGEGRDAKLDIYDLKGFLEEFLEQFGVRGLNYVRRGEPTALFLESAAIHLGKQTVGELGQLLPPLAKRYDLRDAVLFAELNLDLLLSRRKREKAFQALPAFPLVRRDLAMLVPENMVHEEVLNSVKQLRPANLEKVELFDVFRGRNVPEGQKSMAYAFTYRNPERTLTDAEVNAAHEKVIEHFKKTLGVTVREGQH